MFINSIGKLLFGSFIFRLIMGRLSHEDESPGGGNGMGCGCLVVLLILAVLATRSCL
jgi:hypothetical protein